MSPAACLPALGADSHGVPAFSPDIWVCDETWWLLSLKVTVTLEITNNEQTCRQQILAQAPAVPTCRSVGMGWWVPPFHCCFTPLALGWGFLQDWGVSRLRCGGSTPKPRYSRLWVPLPSFLFWIFCIVGNMHLCWRCLCLGPGMGTTGKRCPHLPYGASADRHVSRHVCCGVWQGGVCTAFLSRGRWILWVTYSCLCPSAQASEQLTCFGIRGSMDNWVNERLKGLEVWSKFSQCCWMPHSISAVWCLHIQCGKGTWEHHAKGPWCFWLVPGGENESNAKHCKACHVPSGCPVKQQMKSSVVEGWVTHGRRNDPHIHKQCRAVTWLLPVRSCVLEWG